MGQPPPLDPTFHLDGRTTTNLGAADQSFDVAVQPDGKPVLVGTSAGDFAAERYTAAGSPDPAFAALLQADGRLLLAGMTDAAGPDDFAAARYANATGDTPTAAQIVDFRATSEGAGKASITWETVTEAGVLGFHAYRALSAEGPWLRVNADLVPARGSAATGAQYGLTDVPGIGVFYYVLEAVDDDGTTHAHGPALVTVQGRALYLPTLMLRSGGGRVGGRVGGRSQ